MNIEIPGVQFVKVTPETLLEFLDQAKERIVMAKAGYFVNEVQKLLSMAERNIQCDVFVDTNENSVRFGFGEKDALELLKKQTNVLNVQIANHIRLSIVIVDDNALVYSPAALSWEEPPKQLDFPNGFIGGKNISQSLLKQIKGEKFQITIENITIPFQVCPIEQKEPDEIKNEINNTVAKLNENPPMDPSKLRKTTFYRNKYKLLKMSVFGGKLKNKSLSLKSFNSRIVNINDRFKSSWQVLSPKNIKELDVIKEFEEIRSWLLNRMTFDAKRFGHFIETTRKKQFENAMNDAKDLYIVNLICFGKSIKKDENKEEETSGLKDMLKKSRDDLENYLLSIANLQSKEEIDKFFENDGAIQKAWNKQLIEKDNAIKAVITRIIEDELKFPEVEDLIEQIKIQFDYYDVSDELLSDSEFCKSIEQYDVKVREYSEGYKKTEQKSRLAYKI